MRMRRAGPIVIGETVILPPRPSPFLGVSIGMERERPQNDSLADGEVPSRRTGLRAGGAIGCRVDRREFSRRELRRACTRRRGSI